MKKKLSLTRSMQALQEKKNSYKALQKDITEDLIKRRAISGFPGGAVVKNSPANAGGTSLSPGPGRSHMPRSN